MKRYILAAAAALILQGAFCQVDAKDQVSPAVALKMLQEGNNRYAAGEPTYPHQDATTRESLSSGQAPFAVVLSCVDSRVPPEIVFDRGLGDMLVIRTAGHVVDNAALGSIEFGVGVLKSPLLVVLGHESCGAVKASITAVDEQSPLPGAIQSLAEAIKPAVDKTRGTTGDRVAETIDANVQMVVEQLKKSEIIRTALENGSFKVVGGVYDLDTGEVHFHDH